ncbi:MAG: glycosyltransferase family protein [Lachnospiraceae bacterium]|nr:glycosyltransferase family protein [Candidatus Colinaster scatohippi]
MNDKKICIIICVNKMHYLDECRIYLSRLIIPEGYEVELNVIEGALSMTSGYNEAMNETDAKYKIYMHQDTFITDIYFLQEMLDIFALDDKIGMIGIAGAREMPNDGVMWHTDRVFAQYYKDNTDIDRCNVRCELSEASIVDVEAVDGFLMATQYDIPWRQDIFDGWDFYDASQSKEFRKRGYRIVVPKLEKPVCVHDDGMILNLDNYDKYRIKYLEEYGK